MKRNYPAQRVFALVAILFSQLSVKSQSFTITTLPYVDTSGGQYTYDLGSVVMTFNIENTNDSPVILTQVEMTMNYASTFSGTIPTLWYSSVSLAGPSTVGVDWGWSVINTGVPVYFSQYGYYPLFQNLAFTIPAHTQYRFALESTKGFRSDAGNNFNTYDSNGVVFKVGSANSSPGAEDSVGCFGIMPDIFENTVIFFAGRITLEPATTAPVTLLNLTAAYNKNNHSNIISWQTAQEINSSHFVLQRSYNPPQFSNVATIQAAGNSSVQKKYSYTDNNIQYKPTYYRLQQTDKDGRYIYSKTVQVNPVKSYGINIYPNPAQNNLTVQFLGKSGFTSLVITDILGRQVQKNILPSIDGYNQSSISIASLSPGSYIVMLQNNEGIFQTSFIKAL